MMVGAGVLMRGDVRRMPPIHCHGGIMQPLKKCALQDIGHGLYGFYSSLQEDK